jgi:hypothetical protein
MLMALTTKINSAIMPLRLVQRAERPIDRSARRGFAEATEFSAISVACAGVRRAHTSPFLFRFEFENSRTRASAPHKNSTQNKRRGLSACAFFLSIYSGYQIRQVTMP